MSKQVKKSQICQGLAGPGMTVMYDIDHINYSFLKTLLVLSCSLLQPPLLTLEATTLI